MVTHEYLKQSLRISVNMKGNESPATLALEGKSLAKDCFARMLSSIAKPLR